MGARDLVTVTQRLRDAVQTLTILGVNRGALDALVKEALTTQLKTASNDDAVVLGRVLSPGEMKAWAPTRFRWAGPRAWHHQAE